MGYGFSPVDVWVMNAVEEGYRFEDVCRVDEEWVEEIVIWEGLWYIVPACRVRVTDFGMNYLSYRSMGNMVVSMGLDRSKMVMFDMAVVSMKDATLQHTTRPTTTSISMLGYGMPGVWLVGRGFKGFGERSASDVVKKFVCEEVKVNYQGVCGVLRWEEEVQGSVDKKCYLQGGRTGFSFLGYLRDCAKGVDGDQDYFVWFSPSVGGERGIAWKLNFKSFSELRKQDVKCYLEYVIDPKRWDEVWENGGYLKEGYIKVVPFLWYEVLKSNVAIDTMKARFVKYTFDLSKLTVNKKVVDKVPELLGKKVRSNIIASVMNKTDGMVTKVINEGKVVDVSETHPAVGLVQKCRMLRKWSVVIPGVVDLQVGDKVRVIFPDGYGDMCEALSGDWIVGEQVHLWANTGRNYLKKLVLVSDVWKCERKEV